MLGTLDFKGSEHWALSIFIRAQPCCGYKSRAIIKFQLWEQIICTGNFTTGCTLLVKNTILSFKVIYISLKKKINKNYCKAWKLDLYCLLLIDPKYLRIFRVSLQASGIRTKNYNNNNNISNIIISYCSQTMIALTWWEWFFLLMNWI